MNAQPLIDAVGKYYKAVEMANAPRTGIGRLLQPVFSRVQIFAARRELRNTLRYLISDGYLKAARQATGTIGSQELTIVLNKVEEEYVYLEGFLADLDKMSITQASNRIAQYVNGARQVAQIAKVARFPKLPHYPGDEDLACHGYCKCGLTVTKLEGNGNFDVFWKVDETAENCPDCLTLQMQWNPLEIRGGKIVGMKALSAHDRKAVRKVIKTIRQEAGAM